MADEKKSPRKDQQMADLPQKKISKDDAAQVKGGARSQEPMDPDKMNVT